MSDLPPKRIKGEPNPSYYSELLDLANRKYFEDTLMNGGKSDFNYAAFQKGVLDAAKMEGISERAVLDRRTEADKAADAAKDLCRMDRSALELIDDEITALETAMDTADSLSLSYLSGVLDGAEGDPAGPKAWRVRMRRIRTLRERARSRLPSMSYKGNQYQNRELYKASLEAAHPLRFMVYVGRSSMDTSKRFSRKAEPTPAEYVFDIAEHYAKLACDIWIARNGAYFAYDKKADKKIIQKGIVPYKGIVGCLPVGHGKTEFCNHYAALEVCLHPKPQIIMLHAVHDMSKTNLADVKKCFEGDSDKHRRCRALFPNVSLADYHNDATRLRIVQRNPTKSPTITAAAVGSARLGTDSHLQIWDDIVERTDADQPTERESRWKNVQGTFGTRQRGQNTFTIVVGTLWHAQDVLMRLIGMAKEAARTNSQRGICYLVSIQRCGGPKTTPAFAPLWPKIHSSFELKAKYNELGPSLYAAAMMMNPITEEQRIVKRLRLYDPSAPEHQGFLENSVKYISLDPAATKESNSDKAGIVYAGIGDVRVEKEIEGVRVVETEKRIRFLDCHQIHATQSELTEYVETFALQREVGYVLCEAVGGFAALVEMFQSKGIDAIPFNPRGKSKENRLRGVAAMLEDSTADLGVRACVEFPGVMNDRGQLVLHPKFEEAKNQIIDFGVCSSDHIVDAVSQLCGYLAPECGVGRGMVSERVRETERVAKDPRLAAIISKMMRKHEHDGTPVEQEEHRWITQEWR